MAAAFFNPYVPWSPFYPHKSPSSESTHIDHSTHQSHREMEKRIEEENLKSIQETLQIKALNQKQAQEKFALLEQEQNSITQIGQEAYIDKLIEIRQLDAENVTYGLRLARAYFDNHDVKQANQIINSFVFPLNENDQYDYFYLKATINYRLAEDQYSKNQSTTHQSIDYLANCLDIFARKSYEQKAWYELKDQVIDLAMLVYQNGIETIKKNQFDSYHNNKMIWNTLHILYEQLSRIHVKPFIHPPSLNSIPKKISANTLMDICHKIAVKQNNHNHCFFRHAATIKTKKGKKMIHAAMAATSAHKDKNNFVELNECLTYKENQQSLSLLEVLQSTHDRFNKKGESCAYTAFKRRIAQEDEDLVQVIIDLENKVEDNISTKAFTK